MRQLAELKSLQRYLPTAMATVVIVASGALLNGQGPARTPWTTAPPPDFLPREPATQLALKITEAFTLAGVGDIIQRMPIAKFGDPAFQRLVKTMQEADVAVANLESQILDVRSAQHPFGGQYGPKEIAADLRAMGIDMVNRANNLTMSSGENAMLSTARYLEEQGIVHAGAGVNLEDARAARFLDTPKGRVALVGMFAMDEPSPFSRTAATYQFASLYGAVRGRPGLNPLRLTPQYVVTQEQLDALKNIRSALLARRGEVAHPIGPVSSGEAPNRLQLFETWYKVGPQVGDKSYRMNEGDLRDILRSIRNAKYYADFVIAISNVHQNSFAFQAYSQDNSVPDFLVEFARKTIDNGADAFLASGVHTLRGVEIYKGKPIFYGLSNYIYQLSYMDPDAEHVESRFSQPELTDAEIQEKRDAWVHTDDNTEVLLATSHYDKGRLIEVRLFPADVGGNKTRLLSRVGIPMTPSVEVAQRILKKMQTLSKPFGTTIVIEDNVGVIRVADKAQASSTPE